MQNIQVVLEETPIILLKLSLMDEEGMFIESTPAVKPVKGQKCKRTWFADLQRRKRRI